MINGTGYTSNGETPPKTKIKILQQELDTIIKTNGNNLLIIMAQTIFK